ncbi:NitT/TauT family transport system ATP-binding protein [Amphibacillus marinus]|uniref:NitT/TauT family transport system ATP-binding protein n=1 Tax=Amphibacillus marinus TaxID=872970 RepID=A0A1H8S1N0_9BACI|nr:ABC transporter ATP-binding protein [Amphibacillus marinus]SEO72447.1 NitT/TauT family transport system ATP-binding protein [Amphibacillus marinus]
MSYLELDGISHYYFSEQQCKQAIDQVSLSIEKGKFTALLGPSGCGKTTLLSIIAQLIKPTEGAVTIERRSVEQHSRMIGYMLQQDYLFPWKTILDNVCIGPKLHGELTELEFNKAKALLRKVSLDHVEELYPNQLSGGMRQRVALARTLMTDPAILLLDEPFSALDFQTKLLLENFMVEMLSQYKKTAILVTHDIGEAIAMSDDIYLMQPNPGRIHLHLTVPEVVRELSPIEARRHPEYHRLFDEIWKEMTELDQQESK